MLNGTAALSLIAGLTLAAPMAAADAQPAAPITAVADRAAPTPSTTDASAYADREAANAPAADFTGGNDEGHPYVVVGISASTLIVILLLVLIL